MPARVFRLERHHVFAVLVLLLFVPVCVEAQTSRITLQGTVSKTVDLSVLPNSTHGDVDVHIVSSGSSVLITLSGNASQSPVIRVPLLLRSNSGFKISAVFESTTAELSQLSVVDVRATGALASSLATNALDITPRFDRRIDNPATTALLPTDVSQPLLLLSGPRVSLGGTLNSSNNALEVTLLVRVKPRSGEPWSINWLLSGTAE